MPVPGGPPPGFPSNVDQCRPYKQPSDATVYVVGSDYLKHAFVSWAAFLACGFTAANITDDTIGNLDRIYTGSAIGGLADYQAIGCLAAGPPPGPPAVTGRCSSYIVGECTWGACQLADWVKDGWGDARDWPHFASLAGFNEDIVPTVGAVVCYGAGHGYSTLGHLGWVTAVHPDGRFDVREMNYTAFDAYDLRTSTMDDVTTFILPPGVLPGQPPTGPPAGQVVPPADLETAWQQFADFWNVSIDQRVDELARIVVGLEAS